MTKITAPRPSAIVPAAPTELTFNLVAALPGRASSPHTSRAYFRWIDQYLVDIAGLKPTDGDSRVHRMSMLSVKLLAGQSQRPAASGMVGHVGACREWQTGH